MSGSIDERVVHMRFDNAAFHNGIRSTLDDLKALQQGLKLPGAANGLGEISKAASRFSLAGMGEQIRGVLGQFNALQVVAVTALSTIANKAINAGAQLANSITIKPIMDGLREYETGLNSVQTILANTGLEGSEGLAKVNAKLSELNTYSDQTIYNFGEMARNIGTFTAAGVNLDTSTAAIKGIANLAALSGSNSQQASTAMYQLSQAMAAGKATLVDWNSVVNAGMGGKVFQDALIETARVQGVAVDDLIKKNGSFRDSLQEGWLTSGVLTETLSKFTGDLNAEQLKTMGYNEEQIAGIIKMGQTAQDAATKIKTVSQLIGTLQESATSGWAQTWQLVFGDFEEAKSLFTNVNNVLGGMLQASSDARNKVIGDWKALGGRGVLIEGLSNAFNALMSVIKPVSAAFKQIFPPATGQQLYNITVAIRDFTAGLKIGGTTANNLQRTFAGFFAVLGLGWEVIKAAGSALLDLLGVATSGAGGFLEFTAGIGDFLVALLEATRRGEGLKKFFDGLAKVIAAPIKLIQALAKAFAGLFAGADLGSVGKSFGDLVSKGLSLQGVGKIIGDVWNNVLDTFSKAGSALEPIISKVSEFFKGLGSQFESTFGEFDYESFLATINTGLLAGLLLILKNFTANLFSIDIGGNFFSSLTDGFESLTDTLGGMQSTLKAATLFGIAAAILMLASALAMLSHIDADGLTRGSIAIGALFAQLIGATAAFAAIGTFKQFTKLPLLGAGLILISAALKILADAVVELSTLNWEELATGLTGVLTLLAGMAGVAKLLSGSAPGMVTAGAGLILISVAIRILVSAVEDFAGMDWEGIAKGLVGVAGLLGALALFSKLQAANSGGLASAAGIVLLAAAVKILASAVGDFAGMSWEGIAKGLAGAAGGLAIMAGALKLIPPASLLSAAAVFVVAASLGMIADAIGQMGSVPWEVVGKGLVTMAGALALIAGALLLLPPTSLLSAAAIFIVAASLSIIADALGQMGGMSWGEIAKGLVTLAGSLAIIAGAMYLMVAALPGALALAVVAGALSLLGPVLVSFGDMSWESIAKGLVTLAGAFVVIGLAGLVLTPLIPSLIGLGVAVTLLGIGCLAAGAGVLMFSAGLAALAVSGAAGAAAIVAIVMALLELLPEIVKQLGLAIIAFAKVIAAAGPAIVDAITTVLMSLLQAIIRISPKITETLNALVTLLVNVLVNAIPRLINAGLQMVIGILTGIRNNIGQIVTVAGDIIVRFLAAIGAQIPRVVQQGVTLAVQFVNGVANGIRGGSAQMNAAGLNLASAIVQGMVSGIRAGIGAVVSAAKTMAQSAFNAAKAALDINSPSKKFRELGEFTSEGFAQGLEGNRDKIEASIDKMVNGLEDALQSTNDAIDKQKDKIADLTEKRDADNKAIEEQGVALAEARHKDQQAILDAEGRLAKLRKAKKKDAEAIRKAEEDLSQARNRSNEAREAEQLGKLTKARDDDNIALAEAQKALEELGQERDHFASAQNAMTDSLVDEHVALLKLADSLEAVKDKLKDANKELDDAVKTRDDYRKSIGDKFDDGLDVENDTKITDYVTDLKKKIEDVNKFSTAIQQARNMGLNDKLYKELIEKGPEALPFVQQLIDSGEKGIGEINQLGAQLVDVADTLGFRASRGLYQSGVDSAQGVVKGLIAEQQNIESQMAEIADTMVDTINDRLGIHSPSRVMADVGGYSAQGLIDGLDASKDKVFLASSSLGQLVVDGAVQGMRKGVPSITAAAVEVAQAALTAARETLGIHSPSREFAEIGQFATLGLANGMRAYSGQVTSASDSIGKDAISAMSKSISGMRDILGGNIDLNPVITPVLDLTSVKKDAMLMGTMLATKPLTVDNAYSSAKSASYGYQSNLDAREAIEPASQPAAVITYNQTNNSPKALSDATIYRQTKNQLSTLKGALPSSAK